MFAVLNLGVLIVVFGTLAKNRWGINLEPVSCPRCKTPLPILREPQSLRQSMWGGWTCPVCGAGVDKWGREVAPNAPRTIVWSEEEMRSIIKTRSRRTAALVFCALMLIDCVRMACAGISPGWVLILLYRAVANIIWALVVLWALRYVLGLLETRVKSVRVRANPPDGRAGAGRA
jgi:hypothetical protein